MKHYSPAGRRNHGRPLKRLLDTRDRNGSTSGPTPWQIYDDDDDDEYYVQHDVCTAPDVTYLAKAYPAMLKPLNLEPFSGHIKWIHKGLGTNPSQRTAQKGTCPWQIHVFFIITFLLHCSKQKWVQCRMFWNTWHYCQGKMNCCEKQSAKLLFCPPRDLQQQTVWTTLHP